jgi:diguanylate cyclase (GGDEF)-like protein
MLFLERIYKAPNSVAAEDKPTFYAVLLGGWTGLLVHICFFFLFVWQDVELMVNVNIFSILAWSWYLYLAYKSKWSDAIYIACAEISIHAVFVVSALGTQYGFQFYLISIACLLVVNPTIKVMSGWLLSLFCLFLFAGLYVIFPSATEQVIFEDHVLLIFVICFLSATFPIVIGIMIMKREFVMQQEALQRLANHDMLTDLHNRRFFYTYLNERHAQAKEKNRSFFLAIADIDKFKMVNDVHGHSLGDDVLVVVSNRLTQLLSKGDNIARWGGEEFMFYLDSDDLKSAFEKLDYLRASICAERFTRKRLNITMSFGLVEVTPNLSVDEAIKIADEYLYTAKSEGRNRVISDAFEQKP